MTIESIQFYPKPRFKKIIEIFSTDGLYSKYNFVDKEIFLYCKEPYFSKLIDKFDNVLESTYYNIVNQEATWFINKPYDKIFDYYYFQSWIKKRKGQVILINDEKNKFFDFKPIYNLSTEFIWSNYTLDSLKNQLKLNL